MHPFRYAVALCSCVVALLADAAPVRAQARAGEAAAAQAPSSAPLHAFQWRPLRASDARGRDLAALRGAGARGLSARFRADGWFELRGACNTVSGGYRLDAGRLQPDPQRDAIQTVAACTRSGDRAMETAFFALMAAGASLRIDSGDDGPRLTLRRDDGRSIVLAAYPLSAPTPAADERADAAVSAAH